MRRFEQARDVNPDNVIVRNNLGILYYQAQRFEDCRREMTAAMRSAAFPSP